MLAWYRNALSRLSRLVIANYVTITKMLVQDGVDCAEILPASIQKMNSMYHDVLTKCRSVSRNQFIQAEKIAKEKMMASMFTHFISEEHKAPSTNEALTNYSQTGVTHTTTEFQIGSASCRERECQYV